MCKNELVSIIVPIHNMENYVSRCVLSLEEQTYSNIEIILIENGSNDKSLEICNKLKDTYDNIIVVHSSITGVSAARNLGVSLANGEYIAFCDCDDYVSKHWIFNLVQKSIGNNNLACCFFCRDGKFNDLSIKNIEITNKFECVMNDNNIGGYVWNKLFRRDIIIKNSIQFDQNISIIEDLKFVLQYLQFVDEISLTNSVDYNYYINPNGAENQITFSKRVSIIHTLCELNELFDLKLENLFLNHVFRNIVIDVKILVLLHEKSKKKYFIDLAHIFYKNKKNFVRDNTWSIKEKMYLFFANIILRRYKNDKKNI